MSTDSHDQTKLCKTSARSEEESAFDGKRIKKERSDICVENGDAAPIIAATSTSSATAVATAAAAAAAATVATAAAATTVLEKRQPPAGKFASNGFHGEGDQLQDLVVTKFATLVNHSASSKQDKIRIMIEDGIRLISILSFKETRHRFPFLLGLQFTMRLIYCLCDIVLEFIFVYNNSTNENDNWYSSCEITSMNLKGQRTSI